MDWSCGHMEGRVTSHFTCSTVMRWWDSAAGHMTSLASHVPGPESGCVSSSVVDHAADQMQDWPGRRWWALEMSLALRHCLCVFCKNLHFGRIGARGNAPWPSFSRSLSSEAIQLLKSLSYYYHCCAPGQHMWASLGPWPKSTQTDSKLS